MMSVIAGVGAILAVVVIAKYVGFFTEKSEDEMEKTKMGIEEQDDATFYKDLAFSDNDSNAPLLVYNAVRNNEIVNTNLLTEFREASKKYVSKYGGTAIPESVAFDSVMVMDAESRLYPYMPLKRIMIDTSEGCARFDFYDDLLVIHDYELAGKNCSEADWNYLGSEID
jgi:hypothetical protein